MRAARPLMPINKKYPLAALINACKEYPLRTCWHLTFEYVMLGPESTTRRRMPPGAVAGAAEKRESDLIPGIRRTSYRDRLRNG